MSKKVKIWEVENEPDYNTFEQDIPPRLGNYEDYLLVMEESSRLVRENILGVQIYAGGLRGWDPSDLAFHLAQKEYGVNRWVDKITFHLGTAEGVRKTHRALASQGWPVSKTVLGETFYKDTSDRDGVLGLEKTLKAGIDGGGAAVLGVCSSVYRWGNPIKTWQLGAWGKNGRLDSPHMKRMLTRVSAYAQERNQQLAAMWGEEYADGNEEAADFAREYAPVCRLGISTQAFDPFFRERWSIEACLAEFPALFTNGKVSCLEVIQRARLLWIVLDGSNHGEFNGRWYHRFHLGYDPSKPNDEQVWAETSAPYVNSSVKWNKFRRIVRELSPFLAHFEEGSDLGPEPGPKPVPEEAYRLYRKARNKCGKIMAGDYSKGRLENVVEHVTEGEEILRVENGWD